MYFRRLYSFWNITLQKFSQNSLAHLPRTNSQGGVITRSASSNNENVINDTNNNGKNNKQSGGSNNNNNNVIEPEPEIIMVLNDQSLPDDVTSNTVPTSRVGSKDSTVELSETKKEVVRKPEKKHLPDCVAPLEVRDVLDSHEFLPRYIFRHVDTPEELIGPCLGKHTPYKNADYYNYNRFSYFDIEFELNNQHFSDRNTEFEPEFKFPKSKKN